MNPRRIVLAALLVTATACQFARATQYQFIPLGTYGGSESYAIDLNNQGQILGAAQVSGNAFYKYFVSTGGPLQYYNGFNAFGIDPLGRLAGSGGGQSGQIYDPVTNIVIDVGTIPDGRSRAYDANANNQIVGITSHPNGGVTNHAFIYQGSGPLQDVGTLGGTASEARRINASGQFTGYSQLAGDVETRAFLYSGGVMNDLGTLGGKESYGVDINDSGHVVGHSRIDSGNSEYHGFFYHDGVMHDLGTLGGGTSFANGINSHDQIVGSAYDVNNKVRGFIYENGVMTDLNTLVALPPGAFITQAVAINDSGQIIATGYLNNQGQFRQAFLLNPVPEPSTAMLAAVAAIGALGMARRLRRARG